MKTAKKKSKGPTGGSSVEVVREPAFEPRKASDGSYKPSEAQREHIDDAIRKTVREHFGSVVAVEGKIGCRFHAPYEQGQPYERYILANGHTVFVSLASGTVTVSDKPAVKSSFTVANFLKRKAAKAARAAKAAKKEVKS